MNKHVPRAAIAVALSSAGLLAGAGAAHAAVTVGYDGYSITATGDAADDVITVHDGSAIGHTAITVEGATLADPDQDDTDCSATGNTVDCITGSADVDGGGGGDTISDSRTLKNFTGYAASFISGGAGNDVLTGGELAQNFTPGPGADRVRGGSAPTDPTQDPYKQYLGDGADPADYQSNRSDGPQAADTVSYFNAPAGVSVTLDDLPNDGQPGEGDDIGSDIERVSGTDFNDTLTAGANEVSFSGYRGDDVLNGSPQADILSGGGDSDGGAGSDTLNGLGGDDSLDDGDASFSAPAPGSPAENPGVDHLNGGDGNDLIGSDLGADDISGGAGLDTAFFSRRTTAVPSVPIGFTVSLDDLPNDGATGANEGDNVHTDVEDVSTGSGDDVITGSAAANDIDTGAGNDAITPGAGADQVYAGNGNDSINALDGDPDLIEGGPGADSAVVDLPGGQPTHADSVYDVESITGAPLPTVIDVTKIPVNLPPGIAVSGLTIKTKSFLKAGTFTLTVKTNEPASFTASLLGVAHYRALGDLVVGTGKLPVGTGSRKLKVSVGKSNLKAFKRKLRTKKQRKKGIALHVHVIGTDAQGLAASTTKLVRIKG